MLIVLFGTSRELVKSKATRCIEEKPTESNVHTIDKYDFEEGVVKDALGSTSLFGAHEWYVLDEPSDRVEFRDEVLETLPDMATSANTFLILEGKLLADIKKQYKQHATGMEECKEVTASKSNPFSMAEALAQKDKRRLWVLVQEAHRSGMKAEEIIGILWWQLKTLWLASCTSSASEAGVKEYPYQKAKQSLRKFVPHEIENLSQSLLALYHQGHAGIIDMDQGLERWVLRI
jgi:DNA polymerase III delta subunit